MSLEAYTLLKDGDEDYIIQIRRQLHQHPELGMDTAYSAQLVCGELGKMGIPFTRRYAENSVVGDLEIDPSLPTLALRADMDGLPVSEKNDIPYCSQNPGKMHACGHDAHTAILLGAARILSRSREHLPCNIRFIFQPGEETLQGARAMTNNGVMEPVDFILGLHVENTIDAGQVGIAVGNSQASCDVVKVRFTGKSAHAILPQQGNDAIAMAVMTYQSIQALQARQIDPTENYVCSVGVLRGGAVHNVIADQAEMHISVRTFSMPTHDQLISQIRKAAAAAAELFGGACEIQTSLDALPVFNQPELCGKFIQTAQKVVGTSGVHHIAPKMGSEDFSIYLTKKPGLFFFLGTRCEEKNHTAPWHSDIFSIDESALLKGSLVFAQFALDFAGNGSPDGEPVECAC